MNGNAVDTCLKLNIAKLFLSSFADNRSQRYIDVQNCIKNSKFHETALPLKVTVRNDSVNGSCCVLNNQQKTFSRTSIMEMETNTKQISNP